MGEEDGLPEQNEEGDSRSQCEEMTDDGSRCSLQKVRGARVCPVHYYLLKDANVVEDSIQNRTVIITLLTFAFAVVFMGDIFPLMEPLSDIKWERSSERITNAEAYYCCVLMPMLSIFIGVSSLYWQRKILTGKWDRAPSIFSREGFYEELERDPFVVVTTDSRGGRSYELGGACERCQRARPVWERPIYQFGEPGATRKQKLPFSFCYDCKKIICGSCKVVDINLGMPPEVDSRLSSFGIGGMTTSGGICKDCYSERNPSGDNDPW